MLQKFNLANTFLRLYMLIKMQNKKPLGPLHNKKGYFKMVKRFGAGFPFTLEGSTGFVFSRWEYPKIVLTCFLAMSAMFIPMIVFILEMEGDLPYEKLSSQLGMTKLDIGTVILTIGYDYFRKLSIYYYHID